MIKLSDRLYTISEFIDSNDTVIDIGCDHALLDIYLAFKYNKVYYASDLRESALNNALLNIKKYGITDKIILRCKDGLDAIYSEDDINTVVISGMGYHTIIKILNNKEKLKNINKLIIESNSYTEITRKYIIKNGFYIADEKLIKDNDKFYIITSYKKGKKHHKKIDKEIGMFPNDKISKEYINLEIKKNKILLSIIPLNNILRRIKIKTKIKLLNKKFYN